MGLITIRTYKTHKYQGPGKVATKTSPNAVEKYMWAEHFRVSKARCYFPRARELRRVNKHSWDVRMSTPGGRRVLMNRILKGRFVLSH
ncbi:unnamed protein product [Nesidiocoris tenuis]|uniref:Uncharacterized protein n=1 Tax=Nesidiocoris tenuis TaxID=355587 RepID=A0A6H5HGI1_9HEMI|nr:unnamed protein product [Nesidiocoris tenuis]